MCHQVLHENQKRINTWLQASRYHPLVMPALKRTIGNCVGAAEDQVARYQLSVDEGINPLTPKGDQVQISPAASPEI